MTQVFLGRLLKEAREARRLTQDEVGAVLGMTRGNLSQIENGHRKTVVFEPEQAIKLCRLLEIDMLDLVLAMGYPIKVPGMDDPRDVALLAAFHRQSPATQEMLRRGLEVES